MTDLRDVVVVRGAGFEPEFACDAMIGGELRTAVPELSEEEILGRAALAVQFEVGMAEIRTGDATGVDHVTLPLAEGVSAKVWLDRTPAPQVVLWRV